MPTKHAVSRDPKWYEAFPDVTLTNDGRLVCVFAACTHHGDRSRTQIMLVDSADRGRTWGNKRALSVELDHDPQGWFWNCPRIVTLSDGRLAAVCDKISGKGEGHSDAGQQTNWLWFSSDHGQSWSQPVPTPVAGIVPDRLIELTHGPHAGRWLLSAHSKNNCGPGIVSAQRVWWSDDQGTSWQGPSTVAQSDQYFLCEGSILHLPDDQLVCFLRENSGKGFDAFKTLSNDGGQTWSQPVMFPLPGCHRPVAGLLQSGHVLITHRFMQGGNGWVGWWTQNTFAGWTDLESCLATQRNQARVRIMPLDFDRSPRSDCGYTGWAQFPDGEIFIVNYIVDDHHPLAQIRGYSLRESDITLPTETP